MKVLQLNGRNQDIAEQIPKKYRSSILNTLIAKSADNGILFKELALYLNEEELKVASENLKIKIQHKKEVKKKIYKPKITKETDKNNDLFVGFDD